MLLVITVVALAVSYVACRLIVDSRAGRVIRAIRDAESRTRFLGYSVESYKLWVFVFSAVLAGIAGALYVPQVGIINPSEFAPINSIEVVIWVAVGGRGTLYGAAAGAVLVNYAKTYLYRCPPGCLVVCAWDVICGGDTVPAARNYGPRAADEDTVRSVIKTWTVGTCLSRGVDRQLRRFQSAQRPHVVRRCRRASLHHRTERRRKDDDDGRDHRKDATGFGIRFLRTEHQLC